jgi:hypothetical protein
LNPGARITTLFGRLAVDVLRETGVQGATRILGLTWDEAWEIKRRRAAGPTAGTEGRRAWGSMRRRWRGDTIIRPSCVT